MAISQFLNLDIDSTLSANSDTIVPSQRAIKTYVDSKTDSVYTESNLRAGTNISLVKIAPLTLDMVGTISVENNVASGFSDNDYFKALNLIDISSGETWKIQTAVVRNTDGPVLCTLTYAQTGWRLAVNSNGSIAFSRHAGSVNLSSASGVCPVGTKTYINVEFTGNAYVLSHSFDKVTWIEDRTIESSKLSFDGEKIHVGHGQVYGGFFGGDIYLDETVIYIDNEIAWSCLSQNGYTAINNTMSADGKVSKTGDTMTGTLTTNKAGDHIIAQDTALDVSTTPSSNIYGGYYTIRDKNGFPITRLSAGNTSDGFNQTLLQVWSNTAANTAAKIGLRIKQDGTSAFAYCDTPAADSNSNHIATTSWVRNYGSFAPTSTVTALTIGSSGASYTAPADGYFSLMAWTTTTPPSYCHLYNETANLGILLVPNQGTAYQQRCFVPAKKGQSVRLYYSSLDLTRSAFLFVNASNAA